MSRELNDLTIATRERAEQVIAKCAERGLKGDDDVFKI